MSDSDMRALVMPKWGLTMTQGVVVTWLVDEGADVELGTELVDVETEKILSAVESPASGALRWRAAEGSTIPVGGLLGVIADADVSDDAIVRFAATFEAEFTPETEAVAGEGPSPQQVEVNGRSLRYLKLGEGGEPVVLVHGFGGDLNNWLFNHAALSADRAVYALDLPGHGESSKDVGDGTIASLAQVVAGFMDALELPPAHLVGHSLGGAIAAELAGTAPDRVRSLSLIASVGLGREFLPGFLDGFVAARRRRQIKPVLDALFADPALVTRRLVNDVLQYKRLDGVEQALGAIARNLVSDGQQTVSIRECLATYPGPTLLIWGAADRIVPATHAGGLPDRMHVEVIDAVGHMPMMEASMRVNQVLGAHVQGLPIP